MISALYNIVLSPITPIIEIAYRVFSKMFSNTGIALVGVSLTVTLLCLPLYIVAEQWQETERATQNRLKGGISRIKKAFSGDEQYMILSTFYRQNHYHPMMALRSSFGILIQIPFFLAAYHTLSSLPDLQGKSFLFIRDMGQPDATFRIGSFAVNVLPILMTLINCVSGFIYSKGHEPREKVQIYGMAALFLVVLYNSPAGLVVYWTMNNVFSLIKNVFYKMKNPLRALYRIACAGAIFVAIYILFLYSGGAGLKKRIPASVAVLLIIPIPAYLRLIDYLLKNPLKSLVESKRLRTGLFITSAVSLVILTGLVLPSSLIASSVQEFSNIEEYGNPTAFLHSSFWMSFGLIAFWPSCIFFLFREKIQSLMAASFAFLLAVGIVNAFAFSGNYGSMDATLKFIDGQVGVPRVLALSNVLAIFAALSLILLAMRFSLARLMTNIALVTCLSLSVFGIVNVSKINSEYAAFQKVVAGNGADDDGFKAKYHLSKTEKNVMIFMLDRFESAFVPFILADFPNLKTELDGFSFYPNTVSPNGHTLMGSPGIYGGYEYIPSGMNARPEKSLREKHNEALLLLPTILTKEAGFIATVSDLSWANYSYVSDMSFFRGLENTDAVSMMGKYVGDFKRENLKPGFGKATLSHTINRNLFWVSLFRESPVALRPVVYYKGTWWENGVQESASAFTDWFAPLHYAPKITALDSDKPTLSVITNEATHSHEDISMYDLKINGKTPYESKSLPNNNAYPVNCLALNEIARFAAFLKENGCYDNTRIILASDHGIGREEMGTLLYGTPTLNGYEKDHLNPLLMVKDFGKHGEVATDMTFMTVADVPSIALSGIVEQPVNPFTGKEISTEEKKDGFKVTTADLFMPYHSKSANVFTVPEDSWYVVKENIFADENWVRFRAEK